MYSDLINQLISALVAVFAAWILAFLNSWYSDKRKASSCKVLLLAEVENNYSYAVSYLEDNVAFPTYRMKTKAFEEVFPVLCDIRNISSMDIQKINNFYGDVESFNRGLDQANYKSVIDRGSNLLMSQEAERCKIKARRVQYSHDDIIRTINSF